MAKPALGRGLGALLGGASIASPPATRSPETSAAVSALVPGAKPQPAIASEDVIQHVALTRVHPCPFQPRKEFDTEGLQELAASIKEQGIVQPLLVRERNGHFELIAGERRWRAAQLAGLQQVPIILRKADDRAVLELALIENLQRENLNPLEEANGYSELLNTFGMTQEEVAIKVGKSRAAVANSLRLLKLPTKVKDAIRDGKLSVGHAKVILGLTGEAEQTRAADRILREGLNVRQTEAFIAAWQSTKTGTSTTTPAAPQKDAHVTSLENKIREKLGTKVRLRYAQGKGSLEINFFSDEDLERVLQLLGVSAD